MIIKSTHVADAILSIISDRMGGMNLHALPYENGREHGWSLRDTHCTKQVAFSEYRNSDEIVVYCGKPDEFAMAGNVPSDRVYEDKEFFSYNEMWQAAMFILEYFS
jgi:hypothetical protein